MKIDYWFSDASGRATAQSSVVNYGTNGVSDHFPVEATFVVR
jgi:endonuclease/exonuclease/phosphatase family metal-dependent hydrolase